MEWSIVSNKMKNWLSDLATVTLEERNFNGAVGVTFWPEQIQGRMEELECK